jgi:hypothetical protein
VITFVISAESPTLNTHHPALVDVKPRVATAVPEDRHMGQIARICWINISLFASFPLYSGRALPIYIVPQKVHQKASSSSIRKNIQAIKLSPALYHNWYMYL